MRFCIKKNIFLFLFLIFLIFPLISAECKEGQVDINSAPIEELDKIIWIGPKTAEAIISSRPFNSLDDLINIKGIGEKKLADIKNQGLACVSFLEDKNKDMSEQNNTVESLNKIENRENLNYGYQQQIRESLPQKEKTNSSNITYNTILLSPKTIKIDTNSNNKNNRGKMIYLLILFGVFVTFLILIKNKKNEF
jgi:competence ComEA-like helix-hairpin-helix protein